MKKNLLFLTFILASFIASAQFEVRDKSDDSLITNGQEIAFANAGCASTDPCNWKFKITNTSTNDIYMKIYVDNLEGTDGSDFQLCFAGVCLNDVSLGNGYPSSAALIPPGGTNSAGNNMWNQNDPATNTPMSWTFRFQAFDGGGTPIGTPLIITYRFDPNLSIEETETSEVQIYPTTVKNQLNVKSSEDLNVAFYNILGQKVKSAKVMSGTDMIDVSDIAASQVYIVRFTNEQGESTTKKIIKK